MLDTLRFLYHVALNLRIALRNALLGEAYAELRHLQRIGRVVLGPETYGYPTVMVFDRGTECLRAGSYCSLNGTFILGGMHGVDRVTTYPHRINWKMEGAGQDGIPIPTGDTVVGSDVWTCAGTTFLPGVKLGDGVIVGAGAVVTKDVPPYAIVAGNPARIVRYRFDEEQIAALLEIRWWDWPKDKVREAVPLLAAQDVDAFIAWARGGAPVAAAAAR
jgi:acetyltransferase-like isoleucine patch superfamily enzyme